MAREDYEVVIGLEVHAELSTKTKIFCNCSTEFGGMPNTHTCPICMAMPGTLPVLNEKVVEYAVKAGLATNCSISKDSKNDRKNYFYPDLPKSYQISQFDKPLCNNGYIEIEEENGEKKKIGILRIHIEEDAGKLNHNEFSEGSLVDLNRAGVPLIEIVSEPDLRSAKEADAYLKKLKSILEYIDLIKKSKFVITNDTGIYHVAVVSEVPVCITAGAYTYDRYLTYKFNGADKYKKPYVACVKMECANCDNRCIKANELEKTWPCLDAVTVDMAWEKVSNMLENLKL